MRPLHLLSTLSRLRLLAVPLCLSSTLLDCDQSKCLGLPGLFLLLPPLLPPLSRLLQLSLVLLALLSKSLLQLRSTLLLELLFLCSTDSMLFGSS